ncbi:hypothetical protein [Streptomyces sp. NPDC059787]
MPHPTTPRPMRQALQPMTAGAILSTTRPGLRCARCAATSDTAAVAR